MVTPVRALISVRYEPFAENQTVVGRYLYYANN